MSICQVFIYVFFGARKDLHKLLNHLNKKDAWKFRKTPLTVRQNALLKDARAHEQSAKIAALRVSRGGDARIANCSLFVRERACFLLFGDNYNNSGTGVGAQ